MSTAGNIYNAAKESRYPGVVHRGYVHSSYVNQQRLYVVVLTSD